MISGTLLGCSTARNKGTCHNRTNMRREELERRVLDALRHHLMDPALFAEFCTAFTDEMNRLRMEASADIGAAESELKRVERDIQRLMDLYLSEAISIETVKERGSKLEARKTELTEFLATAESAAAPAPSADGGVLSPTTRAPARHAAFGAGREAPGGGQGDPLADQGDYPHTIRRGTSDRCPGRSCGRPDGCVGRTNENPSPFPD
jgi:hypothetical protein